MKKIKLFALVLLVSGICLTSCDSINHTVGSGAKGANSEQAKQWYILFGLVPLNNVDSKSMAGGATDYTINTQRSFVDGLIGIFTGILTIHPTTVTVTK
jgi:hypothetical protein